MAGDWIKVEKLTPDKPEIRHISRACQVSMDSAFTAWFRLWCWFDSVTADGRLAILTPEDCDATGRLPGLGQALVDVGWVEFDTAGGAVIPNWDAHNGQSAKRRSLDVCRKRRSRVDGAASRPHAMRTDA